MQKINVIQFLPYFPPHKGGIETVSEQFSLHYVRNSYGELTNVVFSVGQEGLTSFYKRDGYGVYVLPAFDLIDNFPFPKFWKRDFWKVLKTVGELSKKSSIIVQTHTRFFLSSLIGGLFAKTYKLKWVHVEHGSDYVKSKSKIVEKLSYIYDRLVGNWIFKNCDRIVAISNGVKDFVEKEFVSKKTGVIRNGIDFTPKERTRNSDIIKIGFVGRLVKLKGVDLLIDGFKDLSRKYPNIRLEIVGDGDEKKDLEKQVLNIGLEDKIKFLGMKDKEEVASFLSNCDIVVNPSYQEGLPTIILEGLISGCVVVATDVGGTKEISNLDDLIIVKRGDVNSIKDGLEKAILNYKNLSGLSSELVRRNFSRDISIKKYFVLYNSL